MLRLWTYDLAREQSPTLTHLREFLKLTADSGYDGIGLYLEHRVAYPSVPFAHGKGAVQPETVRTLQSEFPNTEIIPFVNLLGHCEGLIYTEEGKQFAETRFKGMQACPCNEGFKTLATQLLADVLATFESNIVHIGGDEAQQLGECPRCASKVAEWDGQGTNGKARLYGEHIGSLANQVIQAGRRPAIWGDMLLAHPEAAKFIPKQTLVFDWQYFDGPADSMAMLQAAGYEVVVCPTLHTYNAPWLHLAASQKNIDDHETASKGASGICLTTWEQGLMGNYETLLPAVAAFGKGVQLHTGYASESEDHADWARLMGEELEKLGEPLGFSRVRSALKCRLLLYSNPFLLWLHHREALCGEPGSEALAIVEKAVFKAPDAAYRGVSEFVKIAIEFVRYAEQARQAYAQGVPGLAASSLAPCRQLFEHLEKIAVATNIRMGGSLADVERCRVARRHVELVIHRIRDYGDGSLGYLPAFEILTHPKFMPHDQGNWWLINRWANE